MQGFCSIRESFFFANFCQTLVCTFIVATFTTSLFPIENIGIKSMVTTLKNFIDKERVKSVRNSKRGKIADGIEEKCNSKSRKSPKVLGPTVSGRGVVLNIGQHSSKRQELLIILTEGKVNKCKQTLTKTLN